MPCWSAPHWATVSAAAWKGLALSPWGLGGPRPRAWRWCTHLCMAPKALVAMATSMSCLLYTSPSPRD
eukprot:4007379-Alexandrium_andersonii.AAC.1